VTATVAQERTGLILLIPCLSLERQIGAWQFLQQRLAALARCAAMARVCFCQICFADAPALDRNFTFETEAGIIAASFSMVNL